MSLVLAPGISAVLSAGQRLLDGDEAAWSGLRSALGEASAFVDRSEALALAVLDALRLPQGASPDVVRDRVARGFVQQREALAILERFAEEGEGWQLQRGLSSLEGATVRLEQEFDDLRQAGRSQVPRSPFPSLDYLVAVGLRVHEGTAPASSLRAWLGPAAASVELLGGHVQLFEALHPSHEPLVAAARKLVGDMQQGLGGILLFDESGDPTALLDGLKLLHHPSTRLAPLLAQMDAVSAGVTPDQGETLPAVVEFARALQAWEDKRLPWAQVQLAFVPLVRLAALYRGQVEALARSPLFYTLGGTLGEARARAGHLEEWVTGCQRAMESEREGSRLYVEGLRSAFVSALDGVEAATGRLESEALRLCAAPRLEEMRELVGRVLLGTVSEAAFREHLESMLASTSGLEAQVGTLPAHDPLRRAAGRMRSALEGMARWFETRDPADLVDGVEQAAQAAEALVPAQAPADVVVDDA